MKCAHLSRRLFQVLPTASARRERLVTSTPLGGIALLIVSLLALKVIATGSNNWCDHTDWAGAQLLMTPPPSPTSLAPPPGYTASQMIFDDKFLSPTLDPTKWIPQIADGWGIWRQSVPAPYSASNAGSYNMEYYDPYPQQGTNTTGLHTVTGNGLRLIATPSNRFPGYTWASGAVTTHGLFSFSGGYVQIRAKMPDSRSGMWACLWFLEGGSEIDPQESGYTLGSANPNNVLAMHYHGSGSGSQVIQNTGVDLSAAYHTYGMEYIPGRSIKMYLDGVLKATYTQNIPTGAYEILMNLQVAGSKAAGWHTVAGNSGQFELDVSEVQVYKLH